ncbi:MAG: ATP cone domain-containing protein [Turneriella sp.]|nr:ATP cone domain-containing protein [Turneriella sp.]
MTRLSEKLSVYLAGPIKNETLESANRWRKALQEKYGHRFFLKSPLDNEWKYEGLSGYDLYSAIANDERNDILNSHAVLAYIPYDSMGTAMGMMYGFLSGRLVVVVTDSKEQKLSKMAYYHSHYICQDFGEALDFIEKRFSRAPVTSIRKRDGSVVPWDITRILRGIENALKDVESRIVDKKIPRPPARILADTVLLRIYDQIEAGRLFADAISVEIVQDIIEKVLMENSHRDEVLSLAKEYIIYRWRRQEARDNLGGDEYDAEKIINDLLHDLKSPVGRLKNLLELLEKAIHNNEQEKSLHYIEQLRKSQENLKAIILNTKNHAYNTFHPQRLDLGEFITDLVKNHLQSTPKITPQIEIPPGLIVEAPKAKLETVMRVLLDNSVQHGFDHGKIKGTIRIRGSYLNDGNILIDYRNNGKKMTQSEAEAIFVPKKPQPITNINFHHGMSQVRTIIQRLGGTIRCVPVIDFMDSDHPVSGRQQGYPVFQITLPAKLKKKEPRILVADNDADDRFVIREILEQAGFAVVEAGTVQEAINSLRTNNFIGAVLDFDFGESRDGIWLSNHVRQIYPDIVIAMITGSADTEREDFRRRALANGVNHILSKGNYEMEELVSCFGALL